MNAFQIMDVTLRDGSYQINFQFSNQDVRNIGGGLDKLGIPFVEIGHGLGIGASSERYGVALHTDEEYLQAAKESIQKAKIGMFCIPGTAKLEQLERLCDAGLDFVRVGTNVDAVEASEPYIRLAKKKGHCSNGELYEVICGAAGVLCGTGDQIPALWGGCGIFG